MLDSAWAHHFATDWIAAWNSHDLDRIMQHYSDDFEMSSPLIIERMQEPSGTLKGKTLIRQYWQKGLSAIPPLQFELLDVFVGVDSIAIHYRSLHRRLACEVLYFNTDGLVVRGVAQHGRADESP